MPGSATCQPRAANARASRKSCHSSVQTRCSRLQVAVTTRAAELPLMTAPVAFSCHRPSGKSPTVSFLPEGEVAGPWQVIPRCPRSHSEAWLSSQHPVGHSLSYEFPELHILFFFLCGNLTVQRPTSCRCPTLQTQFPRSVTSVLSLFSLVPSSLCAQVSGA